MQRGSPPGTSGAAASAQQVLYEGIGKHSAILGRYLAWSLVVVAGAAGGFALTRVEMLAAYPLWLLGVVGLPGLVWTYLRNVTNRYKVTTERVEFERGILGKDVDSLELWRVLDVRYQQSLLDRIFQNGKIILVGTDQTDPELVIHGLPGSRWVFERLREAIQEARRAGRPMELVGQDGLEGPGEVV